MKMINLKPFSRLKWKWSRSVVSDFLQPHGLQPTRLFRPWDFPGKSTGVGCHFLLQGISQSRDQTQVSCIAGRCFYHLSHQGSSRLRFPFIPQGSFLSQSPATDFPSAFWMIICRFLSIYKTKIIFLLLFLFLSQRRALTKNMVISKTHQTSGQKS